MVRLPPPPDFKQRVFSLSTVHLVLSKATGKTIDVKCISKQLLKHQPLALKLLLIPLLTLLNVYHKAESTCLEELPSPDFFLKAMKEKELKITTVATVGNGWDLFNVCDCYVPDTLLGAFIY